MLRNVQHSQVLEVGDEMKVAIPPDSAEYMQDPPINGAPVTVVGFGEKSFGRLENFGLKPGVYSDKRRVLLRHAGGEFQLDAAWMEPVNLPEFRKREQAWLEMYQGHPEDAEVFLRALPETPFWEGDFLRAVSPHRYPGWVGRVRRIRYNLPAGDVYSYDLDRLDGGSQGGGPDGFELVERGHVWRMAHGKPLTFISLKKMIEYLELLGVINHPNSKEAVKLPRDWETRWA